MTELSFDGMTPGGVLVLIGFLAAALAVHFLGAEQVEPVRTRARRRR